MSVVLSPTLSFKRPVGLLFLALHRGLCSASPHPHARGARMQCSAHAVLRMQCFAHAVYAARAKLLRALPVCAQFNMVLGDITNPASTAASMARASSKEHSKEMEDGDNSCDINSCAPARAAATRATRTAVAAVALTQDLCPRPSPKILAQDPRPRPQRAMCARVRAGLRRRPTGSRRAPGRTTCSSTTTCTCTCRT